jgi:hypothetical protein
LRVPPGGIIGDQGATIAEFGLQITGLEAAAEYDVHTRLAPALIDLFATVVRQACGRTVDVEIDHDPLGSLLWLHGCRTLSSAVPLHVEVSAEIASDERWQEQHVLVASSSSSSSSDRVRVKCTVSWDEWRPVEACSMFTVHRSQQFPEQDTFVSVWQLVYEGVEKCCDDVLPDAVVETARSRTTLLAYRVTAHATTASAIQDVCDLSHALVELLPSDKLAGHERDDFPLLSELDDQEHENDQAEQHANLEDMMLSLAEATPLTQFA